MNVQFPEVVGNGYAMFDLEFNLQEKYAFQVDENNLELNKILTIQEIVAIF